MKDDFISLQDVLAEIQRLKSEANRFLSILNADPNETDDHLSPEKKQTLTREVESLQVIWTRWLKCTILE